MKIKAAVMTGVGKPLEIHEVDLEQPRANEVLVKIGATGVCHSDLNTLNDPGTPIPQVLGHEGAGTVMQTGDNVTTCRQGDHVALSWIPFCGTCAFCSAGKVHLCETVFGPMFEGTLPLGGTRLKLKGQTCYHSSMLSTFAEYAVVPERSCIKIPDQMPFAPASTIGCGVATGYGAAVHAAGVRPGDSVVIFGIGGVGINAIQGARAAGALRIIACDTKPENLAICRQFGATDTLNVREVESVPKAVMALTKGLGADSAIDATGSPQICAAAFASIRKGGIVVVVGAYPSDAQIVLPAGGFHRVGKTLKGSFYGDVNPYFDFPRIAELYLAGRYSLDNLVIRKIKLEEINEAFDSFHDHSANNVGRYVIEF